MDVFELDYKYKDDGQEKDEKIKAMRKGKFFYMQLPGKSISGRDDCQDIVVTDGEGWQFVSKNPEEDGYYIRVWLNKDGTIDYEKNQVKGKITAEHKFNVRADNSSFPYDVAKCLHGLKKQLAHVVDIQEKVKAVRLRRLAMRLKKLGYSSFADALTPIKAHSVYCDLNNICEELEAYEDYIEIPGFSRREYYDSDGVKKCDIVYSVPTEEGKDAIIAVVQKISDDIQSERAYLSEMVDMEERKKSFADGTLIQKPQEFNMSFPGLLSMTEREWDAYTAYTTRECKDYWPKDTDERKLRDYERMPEEDLKAPSTKPVQSVLLNNLIWYRYTKAISEIAQLYLSLNADILSEEVASKVEDLTGVYGEETEEYTAGDELRTLIGNLIDSDIFTRASNIEDIAICAQNLDFINLVNVFLENEGAVLTGGMLDSVIELKEDSIAQIKSRMQHVAMYMNAQKKRKKMKAAPDFDDDDGTPGNR